MHLAGNSTTRHVTEITLPPQGFAGRGNLPPAMPAFVSPIRFRKQRSAGRPAQMRVAEFTRRDNLARHWCACRLESLGEGSDHGRELLGKQYSPVMIKIRNLPTKQECVQGQLEVAFRNRFMNTFCPFNDIFKANNPHNRSRWLYRVRCHQTLLRSRFRGSRS